MPSLACRDMGLNCDHIITGKTADEVIQNAMEHAKVVHADVLKQFSTPAQMAEMEKQMRSKIK